MIKLWETDECPMEGLADEDMCDPRKGPLHARNEQ
jgi:hypothetical protein